MLVQSFVIVAPLFALIALGYGAMRSNLVSTGTSNGLSEFVFVMAIPALLFRTVAGTDLPKADPSGYWIAYFAPLAIIWLLGGVLARRFGRDSQEAAVIGFASAQSNTVLVGIPVILATLGDAGRVPIVLLLIVHLPITMTVVTVLIARGEAKGAAGRLVRSLATHPILLAIFAGILWRLAGLPLPVILERLLKLLGDCAAPCALVATGMSLSSVSLRGSRTLIAAMAALKLIAMPALVYLFCVKVFALPVEFTIAALLFAACPTGINAYLVAKRYRTGEAEVSGSIAASTILAGITMTGLVALAMQMLR